MNPFSDLLRLHRLKLDLSQTQAASLLGIPLRTFWAWENGVNTPNRMTQRVAVATLENVKTGFLPTKTKRGRPLNRKVVVLEPQKEGLSVGA